MPKLINQPFEQTFRLQVNLPHNQRMVLRVSPRMTLAELKLQICDEKELDYENHNLVHPTQPNVALDLNGTLGSYGCAEISIMSRSAHDTLNSYNLMICPRTDDEKRKKGILRLFSRKKKEIIADVSSGSYNHFSLSEKNAENYENHLKHSTKRKPAPAPPVSSSIVIQSSSLITSQPVAKFDELGSIICHSRHSSDSSGYHEPSVFSDCSENKSPEVPIINHANMLSYNCNTYCKDVSNNLDSKSHSNLLTSCRSVTCSSIPNSTVTRKRKAPLPPTSVLPDPETPSPDDKTRKNILVIAEITANRIESCNNTISSDQLESWESHQTEQPVCSKNSAVMFDKGFLNYIARKDTEDAATIQYLNRPIPVKEFEADEHEDLIVIKEQKSTHSNLQLSKTNVYESFANLLNFKEIDPSLEASSTFLSDGVCSKDLPYFDGSQDFYELQKSEEGKCTPQSDCSSNDESCRASFTEPLTSEAQCELVSFDFNHYDSKGKNEEIPVFGESSMKVEDPVFPTITSVAFEKSDTNTVMCIQRENNTEMKKIPNVRIVPFLDRNLSEPNRYGIRIGNVQKRCSELSGISIFPLAGRSTSLYSVTKKFSKGIRCISPYASEPSIDSLEKQTLNKNLSNQDAENLKFKITPENFKVEYTKLQAKFLSWQKQLENNQSLLQNEIIPKISQLEISQHKGSELPDSLQKIQVDPIKSISESLFQQEVEPLPLDAQKLALLSSSSVSCTSRNIEKGVQHITGKEILTEIGSTENVCDSNKSDLSKSQTLPRSSSQVTGPLKNCQTMTLNRKIQPKSHAISVSIGSWLQRNEPAENIDSVSVASSRSKFQSLMNIPLEHKMFSSTCHENETTTSGIPTLFKYTAQKNKGSSSLHRPSKVATVKLNEKKENADVMKTAKKLINKNEKKKVDCEGLKFLKSTKPFVRISSMKDEIVPPPLHTLKKWPFPEIQENSLNARKYTQEIVKATTVWSSLEPYDKIVRAEVDLRKPKTGKPQLQNNTSNENVDIRTDIQNMHVKKTDKYYLDKCKLSLNVLSHQSNINEEVFEKAPNNTIEETGREPTYEEAGDNYNSNKNNKPYLFVNGSYLPPPPPPVSTMPAIPPAAAIPKSSLLIKGNDKKQAKTVKSQKLMIKPEKDPREELMLEIRGFGGRQALKKVLSPSSSWLMEISAPISAVNL